MTDIYEPMRLSVPAEFHGRFSLHLYWVSHGVLLLRSVISEITTPELLSVFRRLEARAAGTKQHTASSCRAQ